MLQNHPGSHRIGRAGRMGLTSASQESAGRKGEGVVVFTISLLRLENFNCFQLGLHGNPSQPIHGHQEPIPAFPMLPLRLTRSISGCSEVHLRCWAHIIDFLHTDGALNFSFPSIHMKAPFPFELPKLWHLHNYFGSTPLPVHVHSLRTKHGYILTTSSH